MQNPANQDSEGDQRYVSRPEFAARLRQAVGDDSAHGFAKKCGIADSAIRKYLSGESLPGLDRLVAMAKAAGVSVEWLATGGGRTGAAPSRDDYVYVALGNVRAAAGGGAEVGEETVVDFIAFKSWWVHQELKASPQSLVAIQVQGESMEPTLHERDVVLVDQSLADARQEGIYVLRMGGDLFIKRLQRLPGGIYEAHSDNSAYTPFRFSESQIGDELVILGRVVWMAHKL